MDQLIGGHMKQRLIFTGGARPNPYFGAQSAEAKATAEAHGYRRVSQVAMPEKLHWPLAEEVLAYFANVKQ